MDLISESSISFNESFFSTSSTLSNDSTNTLRPDNDLFDDGDSLSDLLSLNSYASSSRKVLPDHMQSILELSMDPSLYETASFEIPCPKRIKLEFEDDTSHFRLKVVELHSHYKEVLVPSEQNALQESALKEIERLKKKAKSVKNSIALLENITKYQLAKKQVLPGLESKRTVTLCLERLIFEKFPRKKKCFVLVTCERNVCTSSLVKSDEFIIEFPDVFTLRNCTKNFELKVMLYTFRFDNNRGFKLNNLFNWYKNKAKSREENVLNNFELVDQIVLTKEDLFKPNINYTLTISNFNSGVYKIGYMYYYLDEEEAWRKFWCILCDTQLTVYNKRDTQNIFCTFNLKWMSKAELDNKTLYFQYVTKEVAGGQFHKHVFKTINVNSMRLWLRDINFVIELLIHWNSSVLNLR